MRADRPPRTTWFYQEPHRLRQQAGVRTGSILAPRDESLGFERRRPSTLCEIPMLGALDTIGEELIHRATMAAASTGKSRSRQGHVRCKWRVWFAGPGMLRGIARLQGMGSAGSRHAHTIMWHGIVHAPCGTSHSSKPNKGRIAPQPKVPHAPKKICIARAFDRARMAVTPIAIGLRGPCCVLSVW